MSQYWEPCTDVADALSKIESLDGYFVECARIGQGINTKETVWMRGAMVFAIQAGHSFLRIDDTLRSETAKNVLRFAVREALPGIEKLFAPKEA